MKQYTFLKSLLFSVLFASVGCALAATPAKKNPVKARVTRSVPKVSAIHVTRIVHLGHSSQLLKYYQSRMFNGTKMSVDYGKYRFLTEQVPGVTYSALMTQESRGSSNVTMYTVTRLQKVTGFANYDYIGNKIMGRGIFAGGLGFRNIFSENDELFMRGAITSKPFNSGTVTASYRKVVGKSGTQIRAEYTRSYSNAPPVQYAFQGTGNTYTLSVYQPLILEGLRSLYFTGGITHLDGMNIGFWQLGQVAGGGFQGAFPDLITYTKMTYLFAGINYESMNSLGTLTANATVTQDLLPQRFDYSVTGLPAGSRTDGQPQSAFTRFDAGASQLFVLSARVRLYINALGQWSPNAPLDLSQKFVFGDGAYLSQNFFGDNGVSSKVELRYNETVNRRYLRALQYYAFGAVGYLHNDSDALIAYKNKSVQTAGLGIRASVSRHVRAFVEGAKPFETLPVDNDKDWLVFFGAGYHF